MRKAFGFVLIALAIGGCSSGPRKSIDPAHGGMVTYDLGDAKMNAAIAEAKETLPGFIKRLPNLKPDQANVKWAAATKKGHTEHIWVGYLTYKDGWFEGRLINEPEWIEGKKLGDEVRFPSSEVSDWVIWKEDGGQEGGYTDKVMVSDTQSGGK